MFSFVLFLAIIITMLTFIGLDMLTHFSGVINLIGAIVLGIGVFLTLKPNKKKDFKLDLGENENAKFLEESYKKALEDYNYVKGSFSILKIMN